jgi:hypothetical protein
MKKSMLAMSVAAAIGGLGFAGGALAIQSTSLTYANATDLVVNPGGIGHQLLFPYFSTQGDNATLINVVNTDTVGKVVKFRFRGAGNSDDLFDFQVLMSPGDVWTAAVTKDATTGASKLTTTDKTCTLGLGTGAFATVRTDPKKDAGETLEGYLEVLNMADIVTDSALYKTIKHSAGVAACNLTVLDTALGTDIADENAAAARGITTPTTGLVGDWILLNQANTAAWSGSATALEARDGSGAPAGGRIVFWPQKFGTPVFSGGTTLANVTADPLFNQPSASAPYVAYQLYDLPDLSTPYVNSVSTAAEQADLSTSRIAVTSVTNEFVTDDGIAAVTDWLFSQPTRRYSVAVNYAGGASSAGAAVWRDTSGSVHYNTTNTSYIASQRQACLNTTQAPSRNSLFDREETTPGLADNPFVPSPNTPEAAQVVYLCGEANVYSINAGGVTDPSALGAKVARGDITFAYADGWGTWSANNGAYGVPVLGAAFLRASNGAVNYGFAFPHKTVAGQQYTVAP